MLYLSTTLDPSMMPLLNQVDITITSPYKCNCIADGCKMTNNEEKEEEVRNILVYSDER
jgi:hypothetical protein